MKISLISKEWDENALQRYAQIKSGKDLSFNYVLAPGIISGLGDFSGKEGIDLGCGSGILTKIIGKKSKRIVGVDISKTMISLAIKECQKAPNVSLYYSSAEDFLSKTKENCFDFAVANMFFNTVPKINTILANLSRVMRNGGKFVFSIAHPCFWNNYRKIIKSNKYNYSKENYGKWKFQISLDKKGFSKPVSFFHRSLSAYSSALTEAGFLTQKISEPFPNAEIEKLYPNKWKYPRFIIWECLNVKSLRIKGVYNFLKYKHLNFIRFHS